MIPRKPEPPDRDMVAKSQLPPTFRTQVHQEAIPAESSRRGDRRPPQFTTSLAQSALDPGRQVSAYDRDYVVGYSGELRRVLGKPDRQQAPKVQALADSERASGRIIGALEARVAKRRKAALRRQLAKAEALKARATTLERQIAAAVQG